MDNLDSNKPNIDNDLPEVLPEIIEIDTQAKKIDTNRIPKPMPAGSDSEALPSETPLTEDTIAIKKPIPPSEAKKPFIVAGDEVVKEEPEVEQEPERRLKIFCYNCGQKLDLTDMVSFSKVECPSCSGEIIVPKWWDNYLLEEICGLGGMAEVFRGLDLALDREVAIKILHSAIANDADRNKLFLHEARTAATLNHYSILPIYTCGEFEGNAYFVMQYMGGGSLEDELEKGDDDRLKVSEATKWMKDICEGLDNARRHGIIHHDIKPGNFMLDEDRNVKIGDFGISQALHDSRSDEVNELTKHWGSPDYVSPEKVTTSKETYLGDIYSLGATFYHLLTGEPPFDNSDTAELLKAKTVKDPIEIRKLRDDIPESFAALISKMMDRTPEARPSYRDIVAELNSFTKLGVRNKKTTAKHKKAPTATKSAINIGKGKVNNFDPSKYGIKKKNPLHTLIKVLVVVLIIAMGYFVWSQGYLDGILKDILPGATSGALSDYLPEATKLISEGNSQEAANIAQNTLDSPLAEVDELKQAALQLAICNYLNNDNQVQNKCSVIAERLISAGVDENSPHIAIIRYLSVPSVTGASLRDKLVNQSGLKMAGEVAIYVKEIYNKGDDKKKRAALRNYASLSSDVNSKYWALGWGDRIQKWYDWTFRGSGDAENMEPLIRNTKATVVLMPEDDPGNTSTSNDTSTDTSTVPTTSLKISDLTEDWLNSNRSFAGNRPKTEDFAFSDEVLEQYFSSLSGDVKQKEIERGEYIKPLKSTICKMMLRKPYKGSLVLKSGKRISGIMMGNTKGLIIRPPGGKPLRIKWDQLHIDQFLKILAFFAKQEVENDSAKGGIAYLRIAVLCDWYGRNKHVVTFANRAIDADPGIESKAIVLLLE